LQIGYAAIPALILSLLFYFDHNVSAQLAQQKDFQLVRPPAYNWDLAVLGVLVVRSPPPSHMHDPYALACLLQCRPSSMSTQAVCFWDAHDDPLRQQTVWPCPFTRHRLRVANE